MAVAAWVVPTIVESGGVAAYTRALSGTASDATVEPLVLGWTLNRALRVARDVLVLPWGTTWLGALLGVLAAAGVVAARHGGISLRLAALVFLPYLAAHALFQQSHTLRYAMPYVPLLALLAASGIAALVSTFGRRAGEARLRRPRGRGAPPPAGRWRCRGSPPTRRWTPRERRRCTG